MIKVSRFSIFTILGVIITMMGLLALLFALLSGSIHRDLVFKNQKVIIKEMTKISARESIKDLNQISQELGLALQSTEIFNKSLADKNVKKLTSLLDDQFHQYFVTAGVIDLKQIVLIDKDLSFWTESSQGTVFFKNNDIKNCSGVISKLRARTGLQRRKIFSDLCLIKNKPINTVIVPIGGFKLKGYLMIITDPSHNLSSLEESLGLPIKLNLISNETIFESSTWPTDKSRALISDYRLMTSSGSAVMSVLSAQNISNLNNSLQEARIQVLLITGLVTMFFIGFSVYILRKFMLTPINKLTHKLRNFDPRQSESPEKIEMEGAKEIYELSDGFNFMANEQFKAQASDNQKTQFLANMSHEIRTPLSAIIGFSETLYNKDVNVEEQKLYLDRIIRNGKHLHQLINDILDLSKIEADQLSLENMSVSVCGLIMEVDLLMRDMAEKKGISFKVNFNFPVPEFITTDPTRLKQILINLCNNAIKFTDKGGVNVTVNYDAKQNSMSFSVKDNGIGISEEQMGDLFKPFKQADSSTTRKYGGTGLGLYVSKLLSENLGGDINVSSLINVGSVFDVNIDAGEIGETWVNCKDDILVSTERESILAPKLKGRILLAEDNEDNQKLISLYIEETGANIEIVDNGKLAVEKGVAEKFDLILMDMQMPGMGGIEAISILRKKKCTTPIVVLTANAMKEDKIESEKVGANCFLTKPINEEAFYNMLRQYLRNANEVSKKVVFNKSKNEKIEILRKTYIDRFPETIGLLHSLLEGNEWEELNTQIHMLKGTAGSFGFYDITELCKIIEGKIKSSDFNFAKNLIKEIIGMLKEASLNSHQ